jgi:alkylhydroperoxidase family enzyme
MPRLPYITNDDPRANTPTAMAVRARRDGGLLNLDRALLYSEPLAAGWNAFLGALRTRCSLDGRLRELAILRIALLNRAPYEFDQHAPVALQCGATHAQIDALPDWPSATVLSDIDKAVLAYTDAMTIEVQVPDAVFAQVRSALNDDQALVELTATVGGYNMVARFLEALQITQDGESP